MSHIHTSHHNKLDICICLPRSNATVNGPMISNQCYLVPINAIESSNFMSVSVNEKDPITGGELSSRCCLLKVHGMLTTPDCTLHLVSICADVFFNRSAILRTCDDMSGGIKSGNPSI